MIRGVDEQERLLLRREPKRGQAEEFFGKLPGTELALAACGGSPHGARMLQAMGHQVRLIPPQQVKPFVKRSKNDRNDAEVVSEAAARPTMRSVAVKSVDQQAKSIIVKHREMLVAQRTQAINAFRDHAREVGIAGATGTARIAPLLAVLTADTAVPAVAREMFVQMGVHLEIAVLDPLRRLSIRYVDGTLATSPPDPQHPEAVLPHLTSWLHRQSSPPHHNQKPRQIHIDPRHTPAASENSSNSQKILVTKELSQIRNPDAPTLVRNAG